MGLAHAVEAHGDQNVLLHGELQKLLVQQQAVGGQLEMESALAAPLHGSGVGHQVADQVFVQQRLAAEEDDAARAVRQLGPEPQGVAARVERHARRRPAGGA